MNETALERRTLDAILVLGERETEPVALRGTAASVWELIRHPAALDEVAAQIAHEFAVDAARVARDVEPVLRHLVVVGAARRVVA